MQSAAGQTLTYSYDGLRRLTSVDTGPFEKSYTYRNLEDGRTTGQVSSVTYDLPTDRSFAYIYDNMGNIVTYTDANGTVTYTYDDLGQLLSASNGHSYSHDDAGNILSKKEYAYTTDTLGSELSTVNYTYGDSAWGDLLTEYGGRTITHDEIGNPLSDGTWTYTWEHGRELASMSNGSITWTNTYNADGLRTKRTNGTTTYGYVYNGSSLSQMTVGSNILYFAYDVSGTPMSVTYNGTAYYYATNLQGDVTAILNTSGTAVVQYTYDAWGDPLSVTGTMAETLGVVNPLRYRGYVYDHETRFYYLQSRYYDPELGRFLNADAYVSTGQGLLGNNMYAYCACNPIRFVDSSGFAFAPCMIYFEGGRKVDTPEIEIPESKYSKFDKDDLYSETHNTYTNLSKKDAIKFYDTIKAGEYPQLQFVNPFSYFFSFFPNGGEELSFAFDAINGAANLGDSAAYDPEGRILYIGEGYNIITLDRVYIGSGYSAAETEYFIYNENWELVYNNVLRVSYFVD